MSEFNPTHQYIGGDSGMPDEMYDSVPFYVEYMGESHYEGCGEYKDPDGAVVSIDKNFIKEL